MLKFMFNPLSTMMRFHFDYMVTLYSFRNLWGIEIVKNVAINLLTSIDPS
ncbi:hypothetical protein E2C01_003658 [Portunus trituberculatus]|uniref:Uncharacterized protein n=1 Tax=Portunus trituberculatus TaxID=210409 RepID=A0A5B7CQQ4_PORTR|nr:hypothetical protein [Portunus trituberculatus]